ncbi:unnamed protein product [Boreogadus saida]
MLWNTATLLLFFKHLDIQLLERHHQSSIQGFDAGITFGSAIVLINSPTFPNHLQAAIASDICIHYTRMLSKHGYHSILIM